jgi:hypothetical protein
MCLSVCFWYNNSFQKECLFADNVLIVFDQDWNLTRRESENFIVIENTLATVTPSNVSLRLTGLFGGNKLLGKTQNIRALSQLYV